jgi:hypothetical protein
VQAKRLEAERRAKDESMKVAEVAGSSGMKVTEDGGDQDLKVWI